MQVGVHVSIAGSIDKSVDNARTKQCSSFQIFTHSPRVWKIKKLDKIEINNFKYKLKKSGINKFSVAVHMSYLPNLSSPDNIIYEKSIQLFKNEILLCSQLSIPYLIIHLGSHLGKGDNIGVSKLITALNETIKTNHNVMILLENSAGQKNTIGSTFEQLSFIKNSLTHTTQIGFCFDTCHAFAAGYDLRTKKNVDNTFKEFDKYIGLKNLKILHLNDSKNELNSHVDRHHHIGFGKIGKTGLSHVIKFINNRKIPIILETPNDSQFSDLDNIKKAKELA